jgi:hypothetical protein
MIKFIFILNLLFINLFGANLHYSLFKKNSNVGPTLLVIGGIHGDEPGGYFAPSVLKNHYTISHGNLWIVPNLNFDSIVMNQRGIYSDMNRKFLSINSKDKDFEIVNDIKKLILSKDVDLVLNLHDGHGFYREKAIDGLFNPKAWGQACIIDQKEIPNTKFGNLAEIATKVSQDANVDLVEDVHEFNVKNTQTKDKDESMRQSLTYFAIKNNKPALAVETSKNITDVDLKVYYQLKAMEKFMSIMGIKFKRDFELTRENVKKIIDDYGILEIPSQHISLDLTDLKPAVTYFPMNNSKLEYFSENPLVAVVKDKNDIKIMNGNIFVTKLIPEMYEFDNTLQDVNIVVDGNKITQRLGTIIDVKNSFKVLQKVTYRTNVIGFSSTKSDLETDIEITQDALVKRFAINKKENIYRIEFYKDKKFSGMILVRFV